MEFSKKKGWLLIIPFLFSYFEAFTQVDYSPEGLQLLIESKPIGQILPDFIDELRLKFDKNEASEYFKIINQYLNSKQLNDTLLAHLKYAKASLYYSLSDYPEALPLFQEVQTQYYKLEHHTMAGFCYFYLGRIHMGDALKHFEYMEKFYQAFKPMPPSERKCRSLLNMGIAYDQFNQLDSTVKYFHEYYQMAKSINDLMHQSQALGKVGTSYLWTRQEKFKDSVEKYVNLQWEHALLDTTKKSMMTAFQNQALLKRMEGKHEESIDFFKRSLAVAEENNNAQVIRLSKLRIHRAYSRIGNYKQAYEEFKSYHHFRDSIQKRENSVKIAELEKKYEDQKKEAAIASLQHEKSKRNVIIYFTCGTLIMSLIIAFILWRSNRARKHMNGKLIKKNEELEQSFTSIEQQKSQLEHQRDRIELLLKEIHHRTKNNLQLVSSLLNLQMSEIDHPLVFEAMAKNKNQLNSMALIHQKLYMDDNLTYIAMKDYLETLCEETKSTFGHEREQIQINCCFADLRLDVDTAIPIGLIVNELITNALKHAFPDEREGQIDIKLEKSKEGQFLLSVNDNGVGMKKLNQDETQSGFGSRLINLLTLHLNGKLDISQIKGTSIELQFESLKPQAA